MSVDGFIDDATSQRLLLSNEQDFDRVDEVRSQCDAILVGAGTIRLDNPSLLIKSETRKLARVKRGLPKHPIKVTLTHSGDIPKDCKFLVTGDNPKLIYCGTSKGDAIHANFSEIPNTTVIATANLNPQHVLSNLYDRGIKKILVEGGNTVATSFLAGDCIDELQITIAPFFVGDPKAPRFVNPIHLPHTPKHPMRLLNTEQFGNVVLLTYSLRS
jgi:5-amino-6-(5-phosphoribosylamino)uracil reductase